MQAGSEHGCRARGSFVARSPNQHVTLCMRHLKGASACSPLHTLSPRLTPLHRSTMQLSEPRMQRLRFLHRAGCQAHVSLCYAALMEDTRFDRRFPGFRQWLATGELPPPGQACCGAGSGSDSEDAAALAAAAEEQEGLLDAGALGEVGEEGSEEDEDEEEVATKPGRRKAAKAGQSSGKGGAAAAGAGATRAGSRARSTSPSQASPSAKQLSHDPAEAPDVSPAKPVEATATVKAKAASRRSPEPVASASSAVQGTILGPAAPGSNDAPAAAAPAPTSSPGPKIRSPARAIPVPSSQVAERAESTSGGAGASHAGGAAGTNNAAAAGSGGKRLQSLYQRMRGSLIPSAMAVSAGKGTDQGPLKS